jgi:uncharacterized protein (TIGR03066 family)
MGCYLAAPYSRSLLETVPDGRRRTEPGVRRQWPIGFSILFPEGETMRTILGCTLGLLLCSGLTADDKKDEKIDAKKLLGKWRPKGLGKDKSVVLEFTKDGKMVLTGDKGKEDQDEGSYTLAGNKLMVEMVVGGKNEKQTLTRSGRWGG